MLRGEEGAGSDRRFIILAAIISLSLKYLLRVLPWDHAPNINDLRPITSWI